MYIGKLTIVPMYYRYYTKLSKSGFLSQFHKTICTHQKHASETEQMHDQLQTSLHFASNHYVSNVKPKLHRNSKTASCCFHINTIVSYGTSFHQKVIGSNITTFVKETVFYVFYFEKKGPARFICRLLLYNNDSCLKGPQHK